MANQEEGGTKRVPAQDPSQQNSPIAAEDGEERSICYWNGVKYSSGSTVCSDGDRRVYVCNNGKWWQTGDRC